MGYEQPQKATTRKRTTAAARQAGVRLRPIKNSGQSRPGRCQPGSSGSARAVARRTRALRSRQSLLASSLGVRIVPQVFHVCKTRVAGAERLIGVVGEERDVPTRKDLDREGSIDNLVVIDR